MLILNSTTISGGSVRYNVRVNTNVVRRHFEYLLEQENTAAGS
jgi:hypothetical protein